MVEPLRYQRPDLTVDRYKEELKGTGKITIKFANNLATPLDSTNPDDTRAALRYQDFILGVMGNPIYLGTQYPSEVLNTVGVNLTALTDEELSYINGGHPYRNALGSRKPTAKSLSRLRRLCRRGELCSFCSYGRQSCLHSWCRYLRLLVLRSVHRRLRYEPTQRHSCLRFQQL